MVTLGLAAAASVPAGFLATLPVHAAYFDAATAEAQLVADINVDRAQNGLGPVAVNPTLGAMARSAPLSVCGSTVNGRSQDMIERTYFAHQVPPCGQYVWPALTANGVQFSAAGENIGWNNYAPQSVSVDQVDAQFMGSPGHRANILGAFNQVGVGAYMAPGAWSYGGQSYSGVVMFTEIFTMGPPPPPVVPVSIGPACAGSAAAAGVAARRGHQLTVTNRDGRLETFALGADGAVWHAWETTPNGPWSNFYSLGTMAAGSFESDPTAGTNPDGRLEVLVTGADGTVCHTWQLSPGGGWSQLSSIGVPGPSGFQGLTSLATNSDGRLEAFAVGRDGQAWHSWQTSPGGLLGWSGWFPLGRPGAGLFAGAVAPGRNGDGRLEIAAVDAQGGTWHSWQTAPSAGWTPFYRLGAPAGSGVVGTPGEVTNADGRLEILARASDGHLWHTWQTAPSSGWSDWYSLGGRLSGDPSAGRNGDGRLEAFATAPGGSVVHVWQTAPGSGWSATYALDNSGTSMTGTPQAGTNTDGTMEALAQDSTTGAVMVTRQVATGGWSSWSPLVGAAIKPY